ncbi:MULTISPECIES: alpha/beta hydrolase [unclassified Streptomyces]|uniref:alpha/beta hydrolase n=1 Tax=unclassified Streptomyces TaxID=2593676 RepID=UPI0004C247F0|nr:MULTISPECIES: alpha/beta hydrolase [unclassified Streptomyces]
MDLKALKTLKPAEYAEAADGYRAVSDAADAAAERIGKQITKAMDAANEGKAADAAQKQLKKLAENFHYTQVECGLVSGSLNGFSAEIASPRRRLIEALDDAAALGYPVSPAGDVTFPAGGENKATGDEIPGGTAVGNNGMLGPGNRALYGPGPNALYSPGAEADGIDIHYGNPHHAKAQDIADRIAHALREATDIDERYSEALGKLKAAPGLSVSTKTWADVASDVDAVSSAAREYLQDSVPFDKSPADRKEWWDTLTDEQREEYKIAFPETIGSLDGIPAAVRDEVNRENLHVLIAKLEGQHDEISKAQLEGMKGIQEKLADPSQPPMLLLGIGDEGNGRAIVSYGNPDTSRNVSAYAPGLGIALDGDFADDTVRRAFQTAKGAYKYDHSTASIVWLGYDAPGFTEVTSTTLADRGAPAYRSFMEGIQATNENADPHVTAIGHSYGSLLVGTAAREQGGIPGVDDIVLLGSPGTGAQTADELNVGKGHVFAASAGNDPVSWLPAPSSLIGPAPAIVNALDDERWFGRDPVSDSFGATRIQSGDGPLPLWLSGEGPTPAHSGYFDSDRNPSAANNIAKIVSGRADLVTTEESR